MTRSKAAARVTGFSVVALALALLAGCGESAEVPPDLSAALQAQLDRDRTGYRVPGISAAVVLPDGAVWVGASGKADTRSGRQVRPDTLFAIASITKTFVSALVLELAEDGELSLDDRVGKWVPELASSKGANASLRQLLQHRSGIYNYTDSPEFADAVAQGAGPRTARRTLELVRGPYFQPDEGFGYSNTNYVLLGMVAERATGIPLAEQIRDRLLDPLGLERISLQTRSSLFRDIAHGYTAVNHDQPHEDVSDGTSLLPNARVSAWAWAAGGMASDARSVAAWADSLFGGSVLDEESLDQMLDTRETGDRFEYGLGVMEAESASGGRTMLGHLGGIDGFQSAMWYLPDEDVTIVVLVNDDTSPLRNIVDNTLDLVLSHLDE